MATRTGLLMLGFLFFRFTPLLSQDAIVEVIDQAKVLYLQESYLEASEQLTKALELLNDKLIIKLKSTFPDPLGGWRADDAKGSISRMANLTGLNAKRSYFKKGGGPSVDIEMVTNSIKIGNIKMLFSSPSMVKRAGSNLKISTVANRKCLEKYDPIDRYAELIFIPTSTLMITIIGQDMKNTKTIIKYAEKISWNVLEEVFP